MNQIGKLIILLFLLGLIFAGIGLIKNAQAACYGSGVECQDECIDPGWHCAAKCCVQDNGGNNGSGSDCGDSSAGSCQGQDVGFACGNDGNCANPPNCSCQGQNNGGSCTPSCSAPLCGQNDGCGGVCSSSDDGDPAAPGNLDPGNNDTVNYSSGKITVSWGSVAKANTYEIQLYPYGDNCNDNDAQCKSTGNNRELKFTPVTDHYSWRVRGINSSCGTDNGDWTGLKNFYVVSDISGRVYSDPSREATKIGGICQLAGAGGVEPGAGSKVVVVDSQDTGNVASNGTYSVTTDTGGSHLVQLTIGDLNQWTCSCPSTDCQYSGIDAPETGLDYFVTEVRDAWFQVEGGSLHANGGGIRSRIPDSCVSPSCLPYLIKKDSNDSVGVVSHQSGNLNLGDVDAENISQTNDDWQAQTTYTGTQTGYDYFARILADDPVGIADWNGDQPGTSGVYQAQTGSTDGNDWSIASGEQIVLLVDGDLVIDNNINVAEGGFLAIIASGSLTVADAVTNVEGVYIADGAIYTCVSGSCGNGGIGEQLIGEGIFVGWGGIDFRRDFTDSTNNTNPAETFIYRPDLQVNAYRYLLNPKFTWQEVAP